MKRYSDEAVVLRSYKLGEADRIIIFLTKANGKVRAVAKGVRKMKNRFGSRLEPGNYIEAQFHKGRGELDLVVEVEAKNQYPQIRGDLDRRDAVFSLLEIVDLVSLEGRPEPRLFKMLLGALNVLEKEMSPMVVPAFYLKLLSLEGFGPVLDVCVVCGSLDSLVKFDYEEGGMCCEKCNVGESISPAAHLLMKDILEGKLNQVLNGTHAKYAEKELAELSISLMEHRFEKGLKAGRNYVQIFA